VTGWREPKGGRAPSKPRKRSGPLAPPACREDSGNYQSCTPRLGSCAPASDRLGKVLLVLIFRESLEALSKGFLTFGDNGLCRYDSPDHASGPSLSIDLKLALEPDTVAHPQFIVATNQGCHRPFFYARHECAARRVSLITVNGDDVSLPASARMR